MSTGSLKCLKLKLLRAILAEHVEGPDGSTHGSHRRAHIQLTTQHFAGIYTSPEKEK